MPAPITPAPVVLNPPPQIPPEDETKTKPSTPSGHRPRSARRPRRFAKANNLNIVPDNDVTGTVTLDVRDLPLNVMMRALLDASDCSWTIQGGLSAFIQLKHAFSTSITCAFPAKASA
jgi:hypothetical protein